MATYYVPRRARSISRISSRATDDNDLHEPRSDRTTHLGGSSHAEHSIYIFPNPASEPPSPGVSVSSVPTDFDFSCASTSRSTSRSRLVRRDSNLTGRSGSSGGTAAYAPSDISFRHGTPLVTPEGDLEIEVELWDMDSIPTADQPESDESWVFEDEVEHVGLSDVGLPYNPQPRRTGRLSSSPFRSGNSAAMQCRFSARPRRRSRTRSRIRTNSVSSLAPSTAQQTAPHPRIHIPLLSLFSSLLSIDPDDPALRLLTHAESGDADSMLFPGQSSTRLLSLNEEQEPQNATRRRSFERNSDAETDRSSADDVSSTDQLSEVHGLPKMLLASISDQSTVALRSLRAGLAVRIPAPPDFILPVPRPTQLLGLWRALGEAYLRGSQAWKEVWSADPAGASR